MSKASNLEYWNTNGLLKKFSNPNLVFKKPELIGPNSSILDVGCGYGRTLLELKERGFQRLNGIDYSPQMIAAAQAKTGLPPSALVIGSALSLPYADESFDAVLMFAILNCLPEQGEDASAIAEARRVLRPGGLIMVNDFLASPDLIESEHCQEDAFGKFATFTVESRCLMRHTTLKRAQSMTFGMKMSFSEITEEISMNGNPVRILSYILQRET
jgi:ubiquinone/menaquinone biosynthesis C-methylase UbiE